MSPDTSECQVYLLWLVVADRIEVAVAAKREKRINISKSVQ